MVSLVMQDLEMLVEDIRPRERETGGERREGDRKERGDRKKEKRHKSKDKGTAAAAAAADERPVRIKSYPPKPTLQQQFVLVQKLLEWRQFVESQEMGEVVGADEQLLRLVSCLDTWVCRRAAAAEAAAAQAADLSEEAAATAAAAADKAVGNLVVTQHGGAGDEEERG